MVKWKAFRTPEHLHPNAKIIQTEPVFGTLIQNPFDMTQLLVSVFLHSCYPQSHGLYYKPRSNSSCCSPEVPSIGLSCLCLCSVSPGYGCSAVVCHPETKEKGKEEKSWWGGPRKYVWSNFWCTFYLVQCCKYYGLHICLVLHVESPSAITCHLALPVEGHRWCAWGFIAFWTHHSPLLCCRFLLYSHGMSPDRTVAW